MIIENGLHLVPHTTCTTWLPYTRKAKSEHSKTTSLLKIGRIVEVDRHNRQ
jgi:hypothetical protein